MSPRAVRTASFVIPTVLAAADSPAFAQVLGGVVHGDPGGRFGDRIANLGDVDGDAIDDFLVGEKYYSGPVHTREGRASVFAVGNSLGASTIALMFVGLSPIDLPTSADGHLLVAPLLSFAFPLPAAGATLSDTLPADPSLCFLAVYLQAIEADAFATKKLSFTPGLRLHLGFDLP